MRERLQDSTDTRRIRRILHSFLALVLYCTLLQGYLPALFAWELEIEGVPLLLGGWWLETAARGEVRL